MFSLPVVDRWMEGVDSGTYVYERHRCWITDQTCDYSRNKMYVCT